MVYPEVIHGMFVDLRSITLDDAEFSYNIRADMRNRDTVGQLASSLEAQKDFIRWQMQEPNDYYFVVLNKKGERIGLIGAYDLHDDMIEVGREVNIGEPTEIMEVDFLIRKFCKEILNIHKTCCVVYANNPKQIKNVLRRGAIEKSKVNRSGHEAIYFEQNIDVSNATLNRISEMLKKLHKKLLSE